MERRIIESIADDQKPDCRINLLHEFVFEKASDCDMSSPCGQIVLKIGKESFIRALDKDVDFTGAAKASSRIEGHERWLASSQNLARASSHFFFNAARAQRTDHCSVFANQHSRARSAIT